MAEEPIAAVADGDASAPVVATVDGVAGAPAAAASAVAWLAPAGAPTVAEAVARVVLGAGDEVVLGAGELAPRDDGAGAEVGRVWQMRRAHGPVDAVAPFEKPDIPARHRGTSYFVS